jgi:hypothetical protein
VRLEENHSLISKRWVWARRARVTRLWAPSFVLLLEFLLSVPQSRAQVNLGPITVGAGLQASYDHTEPNGGTGTNQFDLDHIRLYVNGPVTENIKFMFNTDYDSVTNKIGVLDAVAEIGLSPKVNIWVGRFLPPSDRANLYGPFYSNEWAVYSDGIQDGYPSVFQGRDDGVAYWGTFAKKVKVSAGLFDGKSATGNYKMIEAARVQIDFWDPEDGYYLNGTYYGDKNLLAIGGATQVQDGHTATTADFLLERKVNHGGAFTIESEYSNYNGLGGYYAAYTNSQGAYGLASYLFPKVVHISKFSGKFEILGKYAKAEFNHGTTANFDQKTTEADFSYIIKQFNARVMTFYKDTRYNRVEPNFWEAGIGLQIQM